MLNFKPQILLIYLALTPLYFITGLFFYWFYLSFYDPVNIISLLPKEVTIEASSSLSLTYYAIFNQTCTINVTRLLVPIDKMEDMIKPDIALPAEVIDIKSSHDVRSNIREIIIPGATPPGDYQLKSRNVPHCNLYDIMFPRVIYHNGPFIHVLPKNNH